MSFLWQAAPLCSLVHDAAEGGIALCLAEAAIHSGCGAELALGDALVELFGEVGGRAILACSPDAYARVGSLALELDQPLLRIGSAGGATLLGVELGELREAWASKPETASRKER